MSLSLVGGFAPDEFLYHTISSIALLSKKVWYPAYCAAPASVKKFGVYEAPPPQATLCAVGKPACVVPESPFNVLIKLAWCSKLIKGSCGLISNVINFAVLYAQASGTAVCPHTAPAITHLTQRTVIDLSNTAPLDESLTSAPSE